MAQLELFQIPSPCIGICQNGTNGYCQGCFRSREERFNWLQFSDQQKRQVVKLCRSRKYRWLKKQIELKQQQPAPAINPTPDLFD